MDYYNFLFTLWTFLDNQDPEDEPAHFTHHFTILCHITIVFRTPGDELYDVVTLVQLICHVSKVVTKFNFRLP